MYICIYIYAYIYIYVYIRLHRESLDKGDATAQFNYITAPSPNSSDEVVLY